MSESKNTYATVDVTTLPVVVVRVIGPLEEDSFAAYLRELLAAIQLRDRVALRLHAGPLVAFPPRYVHLSGSWMKQHAQVLEQHIAAISIVTDSSVLRMAAHALIWASRPPFPFETTKSTAQANSFLLDHLEKATRDRFADS